MRKRILLPLLLIATITYSQDARKLPKTDANFSKYLNDGRMELCKNAFKIHLDGLLNTEISGLYERKLAPSFSIEAGGGIIPKYTALFESALNTIGIPLEDSLYPNNLGFSFQIMPKLYVNKGGIDNGSYLGLLYKQRNFKTDKGKKITYQEIALHSGAQYLVKKNLCLDIGYGFGAAKYKVEGDYEYDFYTNKWEPYSTYFMTFHIRVGIGFYFGAKQYNTQKPINKKTKKGEDEDEE